jgi:hypothetical protein
MLSFSLIEVEIDFGFDMKYKLSGKGMSRACITFSQPGARYIAVICRIGMKRDEFASTEACEVRKANNSGKNVYFT